MFFGQSFAFDWLADRAGAFVAVLRPAWSALWRLVPVMRLTAAA